jgi:O-antigen ligase
VIGLLVYAWLHRRRIRWSLVVLLTPVLAALVALAGLFSEGVLTRIRVIGRIAKTQLIRGIPETRIAVWSNMMQRIPEQLWIGHGPYIDLRRGIGQMYWPHNAYLFYLYVAGVFGLCSFLWILGKMLWTTFPRRGVDFGRDTFARAMQGAFFIQIVLFALSQLRDEHQRGNVYYYYMWILFGLGTAASRLVREQRQARAAAIASSVPAAMEVVAREEGEGPRAPQGRSRMS